MLRRYLAHGITGKFLLYALIIGMVPLLSFGIFFVTMEYHVLRGDADTYHADIVREKRLFLQHTMGDVDNLIASLSGNEDIKDALFHEKSADSTYNRLVTQAKIGYILSGYINLIGLVSIDIISNDNIHYHVGETLDASKINIALNEKLRAASRSMSDVYWSGVERNINLNSKHQYVINAVKCLYPGEQDGSARTRWVMIVSYDLYDLGVYFKNLRESGYYLIVDQNNNIIYHPDSAYIGKRISTRFSDSITEQQGNFIQTINEEEHSVNYEKLPDTGWTIANLTPLRVIYQKISYVMMALIVWLVFCLIIAGAFAVFVYNRIVYPIKQISDTFAAMQHGVICDEKKLEIRSKDEIGQLGALFNSFIDARKDILVQKELEKKGLERNDELQTTLQELQHTQSQLIQLSMHDALTGLYNRAFFEESMKQVASMRKGSAGLMICDVDGLKIINDSLGHNTGDVVIQAVATILKSSFRENDVVARIGGDEFAVLIKNISLEFFEHEYQKIQKNVDIYNLNNPIVPISLSMGYAVNKDIPVDINALYEEADNNMYREKLHQRKSARSAIVQTMMKALDARDNFTEGHCTRLQSLMEALASAMELPTHNRAEYRLLARFHDIGKVGIPDNILFKHENLTEDECRVMRQHCEIGYRIARSAPDLLPIADLIMRHHEWWDGNGYPLGLAGEDIPLSCRMLVIVDAFDDMTSDHPYRKAMDITSVFAELRRGAGTQFDPHLVELFLGLKNLNECSPKTGPEKC